MELRELFRTTLPTGVGGPGVALWFSPDGGSVVAERDAIGVVCSVPSGRVLFEGLGAPRGRHAFTAEGGRVALGGERPRLLDARSGETVLALDAKDPGSLVDVALRPDGSLAAGVTRAGRGGVFELGTGAMLYTLGGYVSGHRWSRSSTVRGVRFSPDGGKLLAFGSHQDEHWGIATHHGLPDESSETTEVLDILDAATGERLLGEVGERSRDAGRGCAGDWVQGDTLILWTWDGRGFQVLSSDLGVCAFERTGGPLRELHATPDGRRIVAVGDDRGATLWTLDEAGAAVEHLEFEADPLNGFGLPSTLGEPVPRYRVLGADTVVLVESWPQRRTVARMRRALDRVAVRPGSLGACFAGVAGDQLSLWALQG
ncbi:MAG: hypothetical protein HY909_03915 [Deltaproteobacteria bacterium]|nr:hypothetical protein [Deltaproteobacteria bacterium]